MTIQVQKSDDIVRKDDLSSDSRLQNIQNLTPAQIENYIDTNVTDLASAKDVLKLMAKAIVFILKRELK